MSYEAKIILDSVGPNGARLTTFELSYPRFVHAELMTHRVFSRNSASSRAIPTEKLLARIESDPVLPKWWGKNQSGMQAREELSAEHDRGGLLEKDPIEQYAPLTSPRSRAEGIWRWASREAVKFARMLGEAGLHKQIANRIVEPWMFITVVVTATEFSNFFALRDHPDAQPELADVAGKAHALYIDSKPRLVGKGDMHLPYVTGYDHDDLAVSWGKDAISSISIGRCAAVSYLNQDKRDPPADIARAEKLRGAGHMSPFEHVAEALDMIGWELECERAMYRWMTKRVPPGNLWGWRQHRKVIPGEHDFRLAQRTA